MPRRLCIPLVAILVLATVSGGCAQTSSQGHSLTIAGSTSVQPFVELLAEEYSKINPSEPPINVQGGGSSAGARSVMSGAATIGMLSRHLSDQEKALTQLTIAEDAIAVIVHPSNGVDGLSAEALRDIFAGKILDWSQVGGPPGKIHVVTREEGSGTRAAFDEMIMKGTDVTPKAVVQDSNGAVKETVARDPRAIGYISLGLVDESVKALSVNGVEPTVENCRSHKYGLVRPFLLVTMGEIPLHAQKFLDFIMSDEGQKILASEGLIPAGRGD